MVWGVDIHAAHLEMSMIQQRTTRSGATYYRCSPAELREAFEHPHSLPESHAVYREVGIVRWLDTSIQLMPTLCHTFGTVMVVEAPQPDTPDTELVVACWSKRGIFSFRDGALTLTTLTNGNERRTHVVASDEEAVMFYGPTHPHGNEIRTLMTVDIPHHFHV